jgi:hypothetical protein
VCLESTQIDSYLNLLEDRESKSYHVSPAPGIIGASSSHTFDVGSTNVGDSTSATAGRGGPGAAMTWSPALAADDITKGECGNVAGCTTGQ